MAWRKIFLQLKDLQAEKSSLNLGSAEAKSHFNKTLQGFKLIGNNLVKNLDALFTQLLDSYSSTSTFKDNMKSLNLILLAI